MAVARPAEHPAVGKGDPTLRAEIAIGEILMGAPVQRACVGVDRERVVLGGCEERAVDLHEAGLERRGLSRIEAADFPDRAGIRPVERGEGREAV